ncbi:hypothetical protein LTR04_002329, partial [Oleoguttula sp. CCFEE 6159]
TNNDVIELAIMISACKGGSARSITAVMPYFPYSRQSKKKSHRGAITARMIANILTVAGVDHVITIDLHASQMQGFFKCPVDNLVAEPILARWIRQYVPGWREAVVVSKNPGGTKRVTSLADALKLNFGIITTDTRKPNMGNSVMGSMVFESMGIDGTMERGMPGDLEFEAEARICSTELLNDRHTRTQGERQVEHTEERHMEHSSRNPTRSRATSNVQNTVVNRLLVGVNGINASLHTPSSPLARSVRPGSSGSSTPESLRPLTALDNSRPTNGIPEEDDDDATADEYTDERARDVITGRLVHGHIVDDNFPSPTMSAMSSSMHNMRLRNGSDDEPPPDNMLASFMSVASSYRPENGLGGTGDAAASEDEEEEALQNPEVETTITLVGNVRDKPVFIVDDMIDKAGSWIAAAETVVKRGGATSVYCMATHGLFGDDCLQEMEACDEIDLIVVTDSFPIPEEKRRVCRKLIVLDVSNLLAEAIRRNHYGESISMLYQHYAD